MQQIYCRDRRAVLCYNRAAPGSHTKTVIDREPWRVDIHCIAGNHFQSGLKPNLGTQVTGIAVYHRMSTWDQ